MEDSLTVVLLLLLLKYSVVKVLVLIFLSSLAMSVPFETSLVAVVVGGGFDD